MANAVEMIEALESALSAVPTLVALALTALFLLGGLLLVRRLRRSLTKRRPAHGEQIATVARVLRFIAIVLAFLVVLEIVEVPLGRLWTAISTVLALVAIGFVAVWSVLSSLTAGGILFLQRPFREGDYVQLEGDEYFGRVARIGPFFTVLLDEEGGASRIANTLFFQKRFRVSSTPPVVAEKAKAGGESKEAGSPPGA